MFSVARRPVVSSLSSSVLPSFRPLVAVSSSALSPSQRSIHSSRTLLNSAPLIRVTVDGKDVDIPQGSTVLQACEAAGVHVPRFCYHDRLAVAGNCRMCLVEVEKSPKPVASCAMPAMAGNKIKTDTPLVKKAREGVMEFLLANHPLDCPICDQGGECDLQDQSVQYGSDRSRFREIKRAVEDKNIGPLVRTVMNRCIHCTRCVRFTTEVAGVSIMGTTGRGNNMEIGTYVQKVLDTELSGNVVDLCPVGALTSKPYTFAARPWELTRTPSIDVLDAMGTNISVHTRGAEVLRILPRLNEDINEEWIGDKNRHAVDGLKRQRLDTPLVKRGGQLHPIAWSEALIIASEAMRAAKADEMVAIAGEQADAEGMLALKDLFNRLGSNNTRHAQHDAAPLSAEFRSDYLFNTRIAPLEDADFVLIVATNPRMEAAVLSTRMRKAVRNGTQRVAILGPQFEPNMEHEYLGNNPAVLNQLAEGKHPMSAALRAAKRPVILVGMAALGRPRMLETLASLKKSMPNLVTDSWNGLSYLHTAASRVGALDLGFVPSGSAAISPKPAKFVYLLGAEGVPQGVQVDPNAFIIYTGSHGDAGASAASLILPAAAYTEKNASFVSMEGRFQRTRAAVGRVGESREDWKIVRAISELVGSPLPYDNIDQVRSRLRSIAPSFGRLEATDAVTVHSPSFVAPANSLPLDSTPFKPLFDNYFMTDPISRASVVMAKCSQTLPNAKNSYKQ